MRYREDSPRSTTAPLTSARRSGEHAKPPGVEPYFQRPAPGGRPANADFRIGDCQDELGLADRRQAPSGVETDPGRAVTYRHVDDIAAAFGNLPSMGAREYRPIVPALRNPQRRSFL